MTTPESRLPLNATGSLIDRSPEEEQFFASDRFHLRDVGKIPILGSSFTGSPMPIDHDFPTERAALARQVFPDGVPPLWAPTLIFYHDDGRIDRDRQTAHLAFMAPQVRGFLVPGSTGDAWEMSDTEALAALDAVLPFAAEHQIDLLAGALRPTPEETEALIHKFLDHLRERTGMSSIAQAFAACHVRGITIAAPTSAEPLSQAAIAAALDPYSSLVCRSPSISCRR